MNNGFLLQAIVYLGAAMICVPVAKKLGMGSVLGYLIAGILIGPFLMGFIGEEGKDIMHFAEFGVIMMLFLVGLELEPQKLWRIRKLILGTGFSQVAITILVFFGLSLALGMNWQASLAIGMSLAMSSTAIVLQSMKEKNLMQSSAGQSSFAILLFQDISVIPILAILPLLAIQQLGDNVQNHNSLFSSLPAYLQTLSILGVITTIVVAGKFGISPFLRIIARTRIRELFTASALLIVVGIAFLMGLVGLSPALGTFLAGVILANSSYKHELESDLEPFKGLLLGLFFMAVGASINFHLIFNNPLKIATLTFGIIAVKILVLYIIGRISKLSRAQNLIMSVSLSQIGEFAFVTLSFIGQLKILSTQDTELMMAVTAITMSVTPLLILLNEKLVLPRFEIAKINEKPADTIDEKNKVIIVGFSHFGSTIGRFLRANGTNATILDNDSDRVDLLRRMGFKVFYGDATRVDLLESAGAAEAKILVSAIDSPEVNLKIVENVRKHFPHLQLMIRSKNRYDAYELMNLDVKYVYREHLDTSVRMGVDILKMLNYRSYTLHRSAQNFIAYDEAAMRQLYKLRHDQSQYVSEARKQIEMQEELLNNDFVKSPSMNDHAWDSDEMKQVLRK
jgi:CPA2 family monovalent cation:H+ antiporter-2